jgi:hypothetical protein
MLKRILIPALILNTLYILPSQGSRSPRYDVTAICAVAGAFCAWLAYKDLKKTWQAGKEVNCHLKILNAMGVKVRKVSNTKLKFNTLVTKEHYEMDIPSDLSLEQEKEVKEHWVLFLASQKAFDNMLVWPAIGSLILIPLSVWMFFDLATQLTQNL